MCESENKITRIISSENSGNSNEKHCPRGGEGLIGNDQSSAVVWVVWVLWVVWVVYVLSCMSMSNLVLWDML